MPSIPHLIPAAIPAVPLVDNTVPVLPGGDPSSLYDIALNGLGFEYATTTDNPMIRETAPLEKTRVDQEETAGENTLTGWWIKSQDSFHGGAGQVQLEPEDPTPIAKIRYSLSKNVNPWVPGQVTQLPDCTLPSADVPSIGPAAYSVAGLDTIGYVAGGVLKQIKDVTGTPATQTFATITGTPQSVATDGRWLYVATLSTVYRLDPAAPATAAVTVATFTTASRTKISWVKSRLMLAADETLFEVDVSATGVTLGASQTKYKHPTSGFTWRAFTEGPQAVLAAGDGGGVSTITSLTVQNVSGVPVLQVAGDIATMAIGETILSMRAVQGSFLAIGTNQGIRLGTYDAYYGRLTYGPLQLSLIDPVIPCNAIVSRSNIVYAVGRDYDEAGLLAVNLGTQTDQSGRNAWAPSLITDTFASTLSATAAAVLPVSNRIVFVVPTKGIYLEGVGAGVAREAWVRTSRIRHATVEPKLFKFVTVRGDLFAGAITIEASTPTIGLSVAGIPGFTDEDPPDYKLPSGGAEWLQLKLSLDGAAVLRSWETKSMPGTRRAVMIQMVVSIFDSESTRSGQRIREPLSSRTRLATLEELAAQGDEVLLQEYTSGGVVGTIVRIEKVSFQQIGRPTRNSDLGGTAQILMRTMEA